MIVPVWLIRLMHRFPLVNIRTGPEDRIAIEVADACRAWTLEGRLRAVWWHSAAEAGVGKNRNVAKARMALAKALGMIAGTPDLVFIGCDQSEYGNALHNVVLIELKAPKGRRTDSQADFAAWAGHNHIAYLICRSLDEVEDALIRHGLLTPAKGSTAHAQRQG